MLDMIAAIPLVGPVLSYAIPFVIVLSIVVFVHEYGHYIVGRWCGIGAEVFSIGFGKPLFGWTDRRGTRWQVAALPLGGYVRFAGDMDPASAGKIDDTELTREQQAQAFHNAALWKRALTVLAGPVANFLLSIAIFTALTMAMGQESPEPVVGDISGDASPKIGLQVGDRVLSLEGEEITTWGQLVTRLHKTNGRPVRAQVMRDGRIQQIRVQYEGMNRVDSITPGMPAAGAGILPGDRIVSYNGQSVSSFYDLQLLTAESPLETEITLGILRDGERIDFTLMPKTTTRAHPVTDERVPQPTIGVQADTFGGIAAEREAIGPLLALQVGAMQTWRIASGTLTYIGDMIFKDADTSQLGGPLRIAEFSKEGVQDGLDTFLFRLALLSTSIGLLNLMPVPILDGGHLMFYGVEALRGRPVGQRAMQVGMFIGLSLVLLLMVFATYNDLARL